MNKQIADFLNRILQSQVSDVQIPSEQIGEGKEYHWRSSSVNHEPILIHGESGKAVAGAGKTDKEWEEHCSKTQKSQVTKENQNALLMERCHNLQDAAEAISKHGVKTTLNQELYDKFSKQQVDTALNVADEFMNEWGGILKETGYSFHINYDVNPNSEKNRKGSLMWVCPPNSYGNCVLFLGGFYTLEEPNQTFTSLNGKKSTTAGYVLHEMVHVLTENIQSCMFGRKESDSWLEDTKNIENKQKRLKERQKVFDNYCELSKKYIVTKALNQLNLKENYDNFLKISSYAAESVKAGNYCEAISEAFRDMHDNGENFCKLSQKIVELTTEFAKLGKENWRKTYDEDIRTNTKDFGEITKSQKKKLQQYEILAEYFGDFAEKFDGKTAYSAELYFKKTKLRFKDCMKDAKDVDTQFFPYENEKFYRYVAMRRKLGIKKERWEP